MLLGGLSRRLCPAPSSQVGSHNAGVLSVRGIRGVRFGLGTSEVKSLQVLPHRVGELVILPRVGFG